MDVFARLPAELQYLAEAAERYGRFLCDDDIDEFLESASATDLESLRSLGERYSRDRHAIQLETLLDRYPITEFEQSAQLYFLLVLIDAAGGDISPADWNSVDSHMESLGRFGSFRLASERMHAAKFLADFGATASRATPLLESARTDEDHRVRAWANYALFRIVGNRPTYLDDIRLALRNDDSEVRIEAAGALGRMGSAASAAISDLISIAEDQDEDAYDVGIYLESLAAIGPDSPEVITTLREAAKSDAEPIRTAAEELLAELNQ